MVEPPPPPPPPEAAPPPPPPEPGRCPNCGAPHDVYQEYCLECGRRLPGAFIGGRYAEVWRRDSPIWLWAALAALLLVALVSGAVVALAATDDGKSSGPGDVHPRRLHRSLHDEHRRRHTVHDHDHSAHDDARDDDVLDHDLRHDDVRDDHHRQQRHLAAERRTASRSSSSRCRRATAALRPRPRPTRRARTGSPRSGSSTPPTSRA